MESRIQYLREILDKSKYTVALCGTGMLEEGGCQGMKKPDRAYESEEKYGASPEEILSSSYYNTRPEQFFDFYKNEMLDRCPQPTASGDALAAMERAGKLQCIITSNVYELPQRAGCKNVINLRGSIYQNRCPRCGREYDVEYMRAAKKIPLCQQCKIPVRPRISFFGEMVDSRLMTRTTEEMEKADVLLLLGTSLESDILISYIRYFDGSCLAIIHRSQHYTDFKADIVIYGTPKQILPKLGY